MNKMVAKERNFLDHFWSIRRSEPFSLFLNNLISFLELKFETKLCTWNQLSKVTDCHAEESAIARKLAFNLVTSTFSFDCRQMNWLLICINGIFRFVLSGENVCIQQLVCLWERICVCAFEIIAIYRCSFKFLFLFVQHVDTLRSAYTI